MPATRNTRTSRARLATPPAEDASPVRRMSPTFNADVYALVRRVPEGSVTSYGDIAKQLGFPKHSRHVGEALKLLPANLSNPYLPPAPAPDPSPSASSSSNVSEEADDVPPTPNPDWVPWHRVVASSGVISPRASGITAVLRQSDYLQAEGVEVTGGPRGGDANGGADGGGVNQNDAFGLGGIDGGRVSMAKYRHVW